MKDGLTILLDNAVRYNTESGRIEVTTMQEKGKFTLHISNTGLQLDADDRKRLFRESFFRTKEARRVNPSGMGVGLLVAKTIVEAHKGSIRVVKGGVGCTTFAIGLPLHQR